MGSDLWQRRSIILIGFMGSGKTTVGRQLSRRLQLPVEDTDKLIEQRQGKEISAIFAEEGEEFFRGLETGLLEEIRDRERASILSVGGGLPLRPQNRSLLKQCGTVIYLRTRPETVYKRVKADTSRPLLQCRDPLTRIREMLAQRQEIYESCADIMVDTDEMSVEEIADRVAKEISDRHWRAAEDRGKKGD